MLTFSALELIDLQENAEATPVRGLSQGSIREQENMCLAL